MKFDNRFVRGLPGDPETGNGSRQVSNACYTHVEPTPVKAPRLLARADPVGEMLGIARPKCATGRRPRCSPAIAFCPACSPTPCATAGISSANGRASSAMGGRLLWGKCYARTAFAASCSSRARAEHRTSRTADGRAVLRSSVREFLCSEAMHYLGVPTTRALSLVATGEAVVRDMFYNGNPQAEPGAVVCRVAPSFVRFGNFEIFAAHGELELLKRLADHVISEHFPELRLPRAVGDSIAPSLSVDHAIYARWFEEICRRTGTLIAHWMRVGFVHGVMNTDNMSILGLTIDYGPYGWLEGFDPHWTPNTTDAHGRRYCFGNQPRIAQWNLIRLCRARAAHR